jgi:chromatin segregation and condensation protein Rec8/ScpA/Scc1 (kleisin family)
MVTKKRWRDITESDELCSPTAVAVDWLMYEIREAVGELPTASDLRISAELLRAAAWLLDQKADADIAPVWQKIGEAFHR